MMSQSRKILVLKELPVGDASIPFFASSWKEWEGRCILFDKGKGKDHKQTRMPPTLTFTFTTRTLVSRYSPKRIKRSCKGAQLAARVFIFNKERMTTLRQHLSLAPFHFILLSVVVIL
jgi:hypothetical protein